MKFYWDMSDEQLNNLMDAINGKDTSPEDHFGSVSVGKYRVEFHHTLDRTAWYAFVYVFKAGVDDGYGYMDDGTPYTLTDYSIKIPESNWRFAGGLR